MMLAGTDEVKITPPVGLRLVGPVMPSTGVHDELFARVLVLQGAEQSAALVCLDLIGLDFALADALRAEIERRSGVAITLLNCSHTHSAPFTIPWTLLGWEEFQRQGREWRSELIGKVAEAVCQASRDLHPAKLYAGRAPVQIGANRRLGTDKGTVMRPNPQGAVVGWVDVLRVDSARTQQPMAVLFSHAAHPVIVHGASTLISADYPGYAVQALRQHFGDGTVALFAQGCGGNINAAPLRGGFEESGRAGAKVGQAAIEAASRGEPVTASPFRIASTTTAFPLEDWPNPADCQAVLARAQDRLRQMQGDGTAGETDLWFQKDRILCLRDLYKKCNRANRGELRFEVSLLALGDEWALMAMTHEVFAEYQLWADKALPFRRVMVLGYTNGCESYIPTDAALAQGGYEGASSLAVGAAALAYKHRLAVRTGVEACLKKTVEDLFR